MPAPMKIEGASALVAGGASGLGAATARALHERGASVVIADMNAEKGEALASELGENAAFMEANVMEPEPVQAAVDAAADAPGRPSDLGLLRGDRLGSAHRLEAGTARPGDLPQRHQGQPGRDLQRAPARLRGDVGQRARRRGRARRLHQHRLDRRLGRADRPGRLLGLEGRRGRSHTAGGPGHGGPRDPRQHHRPRPLRHPAARPRCRRISARHSGRGSPSPRGSAGRRSTGSSPARSSPTRC